MDKVFLCSGITKTTLGGLVYRVFNTVKNSYENWLTLGKVNAIIQRMTYLLDHFVVVSSCLAVTAEETISACKNAENYAISTSIFRKKFSGGIAPRPPYWGGTTAPLARAMAPLPRPNPPRLPRLARNLRSLHQRPLKYFTPLIIFPLAISGSAIDCRR